MKVMVINSGSSSIKYKLFEMSDGTLLASGLLERIGEPESRLIHSSRADDGEMTETVRSGAVVDHRQGFDWITAALQATGAAQDPDELFAIGHRVVHGGEAFQEPTLIDDKVIATIREQIPLAPLHNPANVVGIEVAFAACPEVPQVAVFDTAFHQSMPPYAYHYALPYELCATHHFRRYGFHGTSHRYVARQAALHLGRPLESLNLITLHLGNGASATAIAAGKSVDTSMGMTPLEGLVMGTRCGDVDPAMIFSMRRATTLSNEELESLLNRESGLRGLCGTNDMREVLRRAHAGDHRARLAVDVYCYRIRKYIGAYFAVLGCVDALVFTAGVGENSPEIRARSCQDLAHMGIVLDPEKNRTRTAGRFEIQSDTSAVAVLVVPTNEELEIAEETVSRARSLGLGAEPRAPDKR